MSLIVAAAGSALGWVTLLGMGAWYWRTVVPDLYEDESPIPFLSLLTIAAIAYAASLFGSWRRWRGHGDGLALMVVGYLVVGAVALFTIATVGVALFPSLVVASLAGALPAPQAGQPSNRSG